MLVILSDTGYKVADMPDLVDNISDLVNSRVKNREKEISKISKNILSVSIMSASLV